MPFVILSPGTKLSDLLTCKPFTLQAITAVVHFHDTTKQQVLVKELVRQVSERMLINGEKSMDLLQGLLIFLTWCNLHLFLPQNYINILHLAMALTIDLNIDRFPGQCEKAALDAAQRAHGVPQPAKIVSNDERRAVLSVYYLTSQAFTSFRKVDTLNWTPWLAACLDALGRAQEYESDASLVQLVRMQRIMHEAMSVEYGHASVQSYASSFLDGLDSIKIKSGKGAMAMVLRLQQACTRTAMWECSLPTISTGGAEEKNTPQRLHDMWKCIEAVRAYIDVYIHLPVVDYLTVPFGVFAQFAYIFVVIVRATSIEMDGWDVEALREFVDFSTLMEEASNRYDAVTNTRPDGLHLHNEGFTKWSAKTRWVKAFYDTKFLSKTTDEETNRTRPGGVDIANPQMEHIEYESLDFNEELSLPINFDFCNGQPLDPSSIFKDSLWQGLDEALYATESLPL